MNADGPSPTSSGLSRSPERDPQTAAVLGAAFEVHNTLGQGFLEAVYLHALCLELTARGVPIRREVAIPIFYKAFKLSCSYRSDILAYDELIVELKAQSALSDVDRAQVINYLKATGIERALLLNFGSPRLQYQRIVLTKGRAGPPNTSALEDATPK